MVAIYYVFIVGVLLPALVIRQNFKLKAGQPFSPKRKVYQSTLFMLGALLVLAWFTWTRIGLGSFLFPVPSLRWRDAALGLLTLAVLVAALYPRWKHQAMRRPEQVYRQMPRSADEMKWWLAVSLAAGVIEEILYRGLLFSILDYWSGSWWVAAGLGALAFALGHTTQDIGKLVIIFIVALIFQGVVQFTGSLYVAMAVHAIYDVVAGLAYWRFYRRWSGQAVGTEKAGPPP